MPATQKNLIANDVRLLKLSELEPRQMGDCFALLATKDRAVTRDGKPYYRVSFRDSSRSATVMVWSDTPWFADCESSWQPGNFYKLRCTYSESQYGPQLELDRIREVQDGDKAQGFDPLDFSDHSRFDVDEMFAELVDLAETHITERPLCELVTGLLQDNAAEIKCIAAAAHHHHAFSGGFVEHVLSVTRTCVFLADKYATYYPEMQPPLSKSLVIAGAILHDIGKLTELKTEATGTTYTAPGRLIGHILLGRDMIRDRVAAIPDLNPETLLRLEHIIVSHQGTPEWGSPVAPHTPEALIIHYADDLDAKYHMMANALTPAATNGDEFTTTDNPLKRRLFRGLNDANKTEAKK